LADPRQPDDLDPKSLDRRIADAKASHDRGASNAEARSESRGWAIGIEFVGTILVSAAIGWMLDRWVIQAHVPWGLIVFLLLGFAAGTRRAMRTSSQFDAEPGNDGK
jgi:ATP synthase protein I